MASQTSDRMTVDPEQITFQADPLNVTEPGRLQVSGRWYGIRGRRFMRPALILTLSADGSQRRALAELVHKPWAAQDGEPWVAAFEVKLPLTQASSIELSVAPDITVELTHQRPGQAKRAKRSAAPGDRPNPSAPDKPGRSDPPAPDKPHRTGGGPPVPNAKPSRERASRARVERELDQLRDETERLHQEAEQLHQEAEQRHLEAERGRSADAAVRTELEAAVRAQSRAENALRHREISLAQRDIALRQRDIVLATVTRALAAERDRTTRLRDELADIPAAAPRDELAAPPAPAPRDELAGIPAAAPRDELAAPPAPARAPAPRSERLRSAAPPTVRPRNPALRSRYNWLVRLVALLVMLGVIAAVLLVVRSTVSL